MMTATIIILGFLLAIIGFWGLLTRRETIRLVLGFSILDTGTHLILVSYNFV